MIATSAARGQTPEALPVVPTGQVENAAGRATAVLERTFDVDIVRAPLGDALAQVSAAAGVRLVFSGTHVPLGKHVSLVAEKISLRDALTVLLEDTGLAPVVTPSGRVELVVKKATERTSTQGQQGTGSIFGTVSDAATNAPLTAATVRAMQADGSNQVTLTGVDGTYKIVSLMPGTYTVVARRLGYAPMTRTIVLDTAGHYGLDLQLTPTAKSLDVVVTTAIGDERIRQLGHVVSTIDAPSIVGKAPITTLTDLLSGRVAGAQVFFDGGITTSSPLINIRGQNSFSTDNKPLLYIDGVRADNSTARSGPTGHLNDIAPEEIESIEVVKGPSAATMYGTDAANGVILITTKRGGAGSPQWSAFAEQGTLGVDRSRYFDNYYGWGHDASGNPLPAGQPCTLQLRVSGGCALDSVTHFSPLTFGPTSPFGTGSSATEGLQVSGATGSTRYFASGTAQHEIGYLQLPTTDLVLLRAIRGGAGISDDNVHPDGFTKYSARANAVSGLGRTADLTFSTAYVTNQSRLGGGTAAFFGLLSPGYRDANDGWGSGERPLYTFETQNTDAATHFTGGATLNWHPWSWLGGRATVGIDATNDYNTLLTRPGEGDPFGNTTGLHRNSQYTTLTYTYTGVATATFGDVHETQTSTAVGLNAVSTIGRILNASADSLTPGCLTLTCGTALPSSEINSTAIVAGGFLEQTIALRNRLFLKGGARVDGGSTFGNAYTAAVYPKASASWVASDEPFFPHIPTLQSLRFRLAYGESGTQPNPLAKLSIESPTPAVADGGVVQGSGLPSVGNPNLRPERQHEFEGGADLDLARGRIHAEFTVYTRHTSDALIDINTPASTGAVSETINAGSVANNGYEGALALRPVELSPIAWDVTLSGSVNHNKLVRLGPSSVSYAGANLTDVRLGFPLWGYFGNLYQWVDANHNGVPEPSEITIDTAYSYLGSSYPTVQLTATNAISLLSSHVRLSAQVDYRGGFTEFDIDQYLSCAVSGCRAAYGAGTSLTDQARYVALQLGSPAGYIENASFARLREVAVTVSPPNQFLHRLRLRSATITASGRNLAVWTRYKGVDPEETGAVQGGPSSGAYNSGTAIGPPRYWLLRLTLGI